MKPASDFQTRRAAKIAELGLAESDFEEKFARSSGPGGQNVNKVSTAVTLRHVPSGMAVTAQDSRSQSANRQLAWMRILDAIERARLEQRDAERSAAEKMRRQKRQRPWGVKQRILRSKRHRAETKQRRSKDW